MSLTEKLIAVQKSLLEDPIIKDSQNPHYGNRYASLHGVIQSVLPKLHEQGLTVHHRAELSEGNTICVTSLTDGSNCVESALPLINQRGDDQGQGSSLTYTQRYNLLMLLGIPAAEDDDGNSTKKGVQNDNFL